MIRDEANGDDDRNAEEEDDGSPKSREDEDGGRGTVEPYVLRTAGLNDQLHSVDSEGVLTWKPCGASREHVHKCRQQNGAKPTQRGQQSWEGGNEGERGGRLTCNVKSKSKSRNAYHHVT